MVDYATILDDRGYRLQLGLIPPKLLETMCKEAYMRGLERDLGGKWGLDCRACLDIPRAACV
eukprot:3109864-Pyramimonas_sp.AAC.1